MHAFIVNKIDNTHVHTHILNLSETLPFNLVYKLCFTSISYLKTNIQHSLNAGLTVCALLQGLLIYWLKAPLFVEILLYHYPKQVLNLHRCAITRILDRFLFFFSYKLLILNMFKINTGSALQLCYQGSPFFYCFISFEGWIPAF